MRPQFSSFAMQSILQELNENNENSPFEQKGEGGFLKYDSIRVSLLETGELCVSFLWQDQEMFKFAAESLVNDGPALVISEIYGKVGIALS